MSRVIPVTYAVTLILHDADFPSSPVAVITAVPLDLAVTTPFWSTVATAVFDEDQVIFLFVAFSGKTVAN